MARPQFAYRPLSLGWLLLYIAVMACVVWGMNSARRGAIGQFSSAKAKADWEEWVGDVKRQAETGGPVYRRIPSSGEPPTLVLMRDHFAACLVGALVLSSALFFTLMVMIRGAIRNSPDAEFLENVLAPPADDDAPC